MEQEQVGIRERRLALGLTQKELGDRVGVHHTYISHLENGNRTLKRSKVYRLILAELNQLEKSACGPEPRSDRSIITGGSTPTGWSTDKEPNNTDWRNRIIAHPLESKKITGIIPTQTSHPDIRLQPPRVIINDLLDHCYRPKGFNEADARTIMRESIRNRDLADLGQPTYDVLSRALQVYLSRVYAKSHEARAANALSETASISLIVVAIVLVIGVLASITSGIWGGR